MAMNHIKTEIPPTDVNKVAERCDIMNSYKLCYTWTIHNFSFCNYKTGVEIFSPTFYGGTNGKYKWQLSLYPKGRNQDDSEYISIFLQLTGSDQIETEIYYKISILNDKKKTFSNTKLCFNKFKCTHGWGLSKFVKRSTVLNETNGLLPNDVLTIVCDIFVVDSNTRTVVENNSKECEEQLCHQYLDNLSHLFESPEFCDVTLITSGQEFEAHKVILAAQSPVFMAMFKHNMKERQENRVNITDMDDQVLKEMLRFIYTRKATNLDKMADGLLPAAHKYELKTLEDLCEKSLCKTLTIENAASRFILADLYGAVLLKTQTLDFICTHVKEVLETTDYQSVYTTYPHLIDEVFRTVLTKINHLNGSTNCRS